MRRDHVPLWSMMACQIARAVHPPSLPFLKSTVRIVNDAPLHSNRPVVAVVTYYRKTVLLSSNPYATFSVSLSREGSDQGGGWDNRCKVALVTGLRWLSLLRAWRRSFRHLKRVRSLGGGGASCSIRSDSSSRSSVLMVAGNVCCGGRVKGSRQRWV